MYLGPDELDKVYKLNLKGYLEYREQESIVIPAMQKYGTGSTLLSRENKIEIVKDGKQPQAEKDDPLDRTLTERITAQLKKIPENREQEDKMAMETQADDKALIKGSKMSPAQEKLLKVGMNRANEIINSSLAIDLPQVKQSAAQPPQKPTSLDPQFPSRQLASLGQLPAPKPKTL